MSELNFDYAMVTFAVRIGLNDRDREKWSDEDLAAEARFIIGEDEVVPLIEKFSRDPMELGGWGG
jgi:hypothetical protein